LKSKIAETESLLNAAQVPEDVTYFRAEKSGLNKQKMLLLDARAGWVKMLADTTELLNKLKGTSQTGKCHFMSIY
jgi:dihydropteroate synthase